MHALLSRVTSHGKPILCSTAEEHIMKSVMTNWGGEGSKAKSTWDCLAVLHSMWVHRCRNH